MHLRKMIQLLLLGSILAAIAVPASAACRSDDSTQFVCGPVNPEDMVTVPDSPWIVVSSMIDEGHLAVVHESNHSTVTVFPAASASINHNADSFASCPDAPSALFRPHGLSLRQGSEGIHTLYVVGHGGRESVEVFTLDSNGSEPSLTWNGCAVAPEGVSLNSVTALPDGGFAATNFNVQAGNLWEWQQATGWVEVPGSAMPGPNGLVVSEDGRWFYIGGWGEEALVRLSRGQTPVSRELVEVGFHIDNVRWSDDGSLLLAGQHADIITAIINCLQNGACEGVSTRVARADPASFSVEQVLNYPSDQNLIMGTVAIDVGDEIWVGAIAGGDKIGRFPR